MKAAELGTKSVLLAHGSLGWWDKLQQTHEPLNQIKNHPVLQHLYRTLERHDPTLLLAATTLEKLAPSRPDAAALDIQTQANAEYPFFYLARDPASGSVTAHLVGPSEHFKEPESREQYQTARELLVAYQALYPRINAWRHRLPKHI